MELLLIGLLAWFLFKIYTSFRAAQRRANDLFNQFGGQPRQEPGSRKAGWSNMPPKKRKKIDSSVGEYVEFEDIADGHSGTRPQTDDTSSYRSETTEVEQQITDAEWEDIK